MDYDKTHYYGPDFIARTGSGDLLHDDYSRYAPNTWRRAVDSGMDDLCAAAATAASLSLSNTQEGTNSDIGSSSSSSASSSSSLSWSCVTIETLHWLHEHLMGTCSRAAVDGIARTGNLPFLLRLWNIANTSSSFLYQHSFFQQQQQQQQNQQHSNRHHHNFITRECFSDTAIASACAGGWLVVAEWLVAHTGARPTPEAYIEGVNAGSLEVLQWLFLHYSESMEVPPELSMRVVQGGNIQILRWLSSVGQLRFSALLMDVALKAKHVEIVQYLQEIHEADSNLSIYRSIDNAIVNQETELVNSLWIRNPLEYASRHHAFPWPDTVALTPAYSRLHK